MTKKDEQTSESTERVKTDSDNLRDTIAARHREERDENMAEEGIDKVDTSNLSEEVTGKAAEPEKEEDPVPEPEKEEKAEKAPEVDKDESEDDTITIKVDGEERAVSKQEVDDAGGVRAYQTNAAADRRLEEAKSILANAKKEVAIPSDTPSNTKSAGSEEVSQEDLAAVVNAMQYGTEEEGTKALEGLVKAIKGNQPNSNDTADVAALVNSQIDYKDAMQTFSKDFPDIVSNKRLMQMAQQIDDEQIDSGDKRSYTERYADIGKELSGFIDTKNAERDQKNSSEKNKRQSKKESVDHTPAPAGAGGRESSVGNNDTPKRTSPRDTIAAMAASRAGGSG